jgi:hypothetical protein
MRVLPSTIFGFDVRVFRGRSPTEDAHRALAYLFACTTGSAIGISRTSPNLGAMEYWFQFSGVVCLFASVAYVIISTNERQCRLDRLYRAGLIVVASTIFFALLNLTLNFSGWEGFDYSGIDFLAIGYALAAITVTVGLIFEIYDKAAVSGKGSTAKAVIYDFLEVQKNYLLSEAPTALGAGVYVAWVVVLLRTG